MNRGDLRLVVTILFTALTASVITVFIYARVSSKTTLEARVAALEARAAELVVPPVPPVPPAPPAPAEAPDPCDEVSCVLNNYEPACCAAFRKPTTPAPQGLTRAIISDGVAKIKEPVRVCGEKSPAKGVVKVTVRVAPGGDVTSVTVKETPDTELGACVAAAMQRASFRSTDAGGSFSYPFVF